MTDQAPMNAPFEWVDSIRSCTAIFSFPVRSAQQPRAGGPDEGIRYSFGVPLLGCNRPRRPSRVEIEIAPDCYFGSRPGLGPVDPSHSVDRTFPNDIRPILPVTAWTRIPGVSFGRGRALTSRSVVLPDPHD